MKWTQYTVCGLTAAFGVILAVFVVPDDEEIALIQVRDRDYRQALDYYEQRLEESEDENELDASLVVPLGEIYMQYGRIDQAIDLMERFVEKNPGYDDAVDLLGEYYRLGQRPYDYLENLEERVESDPTIGGLLELVDRYSFVGDFDREVETLERLIRMDPDPAPHLVALARLEASLGRIGDAADTLDTLHPAHATSITEPLERMHLALLLDLDRTADAVALARGYLARFASNTEIAARVVSAFNERGYHVEALRLAGSRESEIDTSPRMLDAWTQAMVGVSRVSEAVSRLELLRSEDALAEDFDSVLIDLLLTEGRAQDALDVAGDGPLERLPPMVLRSVSQVAVSGIDRGFAVRLLDVGNRYLADVPVLGAQLASIANNRVAKAAWMERAESLPELTVREHVALAGLYRDMAQENEELRHLSLAAEGEPDEDIDDILGDLAQLYLGLGRADEGRMALEGNRARGRGKRAEVGWALLATASGEGHRVEAWLKTEGHLLEPGALEDVYYVAAEYDEWALARGAATILHSSALSRESATMLARAFIETGNPELALAIIRPLLVTGRDNDVESVYAEALTRSRENGAPVSGELESYWLGKLSHAMPESSAVEEAVYALIDLGAYRPILPVLERLAARRGGEWLGAFVDASNRSGDHSLVVGFLHRELQRTDLSASELENRLFILMEFEPATALVDTLERFALDQGGQWSDAYEDALTELGDLNRLRAHLIRKYEDPETTDSEREAIGYRALAAGDREFAERVFVELASDDPASSPRVNQLLYLWGPRPTGAALDWITVRAGSDRHGDRGEWIRMLLGRNATERALDACLPTAGPAASRAPLDASSTPLDPCLEVFVAAGDPVNFSGALSASALAKASPPQLARWGELAGYAGAVETETAIYERLLDLQPENAEANHRGALAAYRAADYAMARMRFERYLASGAPADVEVHHLLGETLDQLGDAGAASRHYRAALDELDRKSGPTFDEQATRATLLHRLGRTGEAISVFRELLREHPGNDRVRADLAATLLDANRVDEAGKILNVH